MCVIDILKKTAGIAVKVVRQIQPLLPPLRQLIPAFNAAVAVLQGVVDTADRDGI
jgi:hypothetical protein